MILTGIFLIVPHIAPEESKVIYEVVSNRKIPYWRILLLRLIMAVLLLALCVYIFSGIMVLKNCIFPFVPYVVGTVISAIALGSVGFAISVFTHSVVAGYCVSAGYFLMNFSGALPSSSIFYLFSMENGNYESKVWLFLLSVTLVTISLLYEKNHQHE